MLKLNGPFKEWCFSLAHMNKALFNTADQQLVWAWENKECVFGSEVSTLLGHEYWNCYFEMKSLDCLRLYTDCLDSCDIMCVF